MLYALLKFLHLAAAVVWLGGMFFALFCLRPAAASLPPPVRVPFMADVLGRFFNAVLAVVAVILGSGAALMGRAVQTTHQTGAAFNVPADWLVMAGLGLLMVVVFAYVRVVLFKRLRQAIVGQDWPSGGAALNEIRFWVAANLVFGTLAVAAVLLGSAT
jgi:uncharacterized membrane protein